MKKRYRKKPVEIDAIQFDGSNFEECCEFIGEENLNDGTSEDEGYIGIRTLEGDHNARLGDFIIQGVAGEFYPCKPDIFYRTYDEVED